ncbi:hypothetical protein H5410_037075 [Solanum commersonii]|uniref:Uncharacterized protein n=1 Tax=Solanum commersonii TaxID=4109 RepID=A0A9J5Y596_SOLCO|nr:hypothetical protein H5410_037075 [Solanum commersonii]
MLSKRFSLEFVLNTHQLPFRVAVGNTKSYFEFERWWLETKGFNEKFKVWWYSIIINRRPNYILATKWSSSTYENLEKKKDLILSKIAKIDNIQQNRSLI